MAKEKPRLDPNSYVVTLPWMVEKLGLSGLDLQIYSIIYGYSMAGQGAFFGKYDYLMAWTNKSESGIKKSLNSLIKKGLIKKELVKYNRYQYTAIVPDMSHSVAHDESLSSSSMSHSVAHDESLSNSPTNNINILKVNNLSKRVSTPKEKKKPKNQFNNFSQRDYDLSELEKIKLGGAG